MGLVVRRPRREELEGLAPLWRELVLDYGGSDGLEYGPEAEEMWRRYASMAISGEGDAGMLVAELDGALAGYLLYRVVRPPLPSRFDDRVYISDLVVGRAFRRRGVATSLLDGLMRSLGEGEHEIYLRVPSGNAPAISLYRKLGFEVKELVMGRAVQRPRERSD